MGIFAPALAIPQDVVITRLPASRRNRSFRPVGHRTAKQAPRTNSGPVLPALALAGATNAKIVVVSADQLQRERAPAAQPVVRRPRIVPSGLSGRWAFEAPFADSTDSPKRSSEKLSAASKRNCLYLSSRCGLQSLLTMHSELEIECLSRAQQG